MQRCAHMEVPVRAEADGYHGMANHHAAWGNPGGMAHSKHAPSENMSDATE